MRRPDICLYLGSADRAELQALPTNRNTARIITRERRALDTLDEIRGNR